MRSEVEVNKAQNCSHSENIAGLQGSVASLNNHISVVTGQNMELTKELTSFSEANEHLRMQLDRKARISEVFARNDAQLKGS